MWYDVMNIIEREKETPPGCSQFLLRSGKERKINHLLNFHLPTTFCGRIFFDFEIYLVDIWLERETTLFFVCMGGDWQMFIAFQVLNR